MPLITLARLLVLVALGAVLLPTTRAAEKTENVFFIISDGLRWQEIFTGAEERLISREFGAVHNTNYVRKTYWNPDANERRKLLMPFLWSEFASHGAIVGNPARNSHVRVSNGKNFSYPGYSEMLCGYGDPRIDSNDKTPNPNTNVFEWLHSLPRYKKSTAVFASWNVFPYIFNVERSRLPIWPAWESKYSDIEIPVDQTFRELFLDSTPPTESVTHDTILFQAAKKYIQEKRPRVFFLGFGDTDELAHAGRYGDYLRAANRVDAYIQRLWELTQSISQYRNKTAFVFATDHGRGNGTSSWKGHGESIKESDAIWIAALGSGIKNLGEASNTPAATQSQLAATIAALIGKDFNKAEPKAAPPLDFLMK